MKVLLQISGIAKQRPVLSALGALVVSIICFAGIMRFWITTDGGREFVASQINGRDVGGYGELRVRGLGGDPLGEMSIDSIELHDPKGAWIIVRDVRVDWTPWTLFAREVDFRSFSASSVTVLRQPIRTRPARPSTTLPNIRLNAGTIQRLDLAEGVAGAASSYSVRARFVTTEWGEIDSEFELLPLSGAGDRIEARVIRRRDLSYDIEVDAVAPQGGTFAHLLRLKPGSSAELTASAAGGLTDGRGEARYSINGVDQLFFSGEVVRGTIDANLRFSASALPVSPELAQFVGDTAIIDVTGRIGDGLTAQLDARFASGTARLSATFDPSDLTFAWPVRVQANLDSLAPYWSGADHLKFDGDLTRSLDGLSFDGVADLTISAQSGLPFHSANGPVSLTLLQDRIPFEVGLQVQGPAKTIPVLAKALGGEVSVAGNGTFLLSEKRILIDAADLNHATGTAQLLGELDASDGSINLSGKVTQKIDPLFPELSGTTTGFAQVRGTVHDAEVGLNLAFSRIDGYPELVRPIFDGPGTIRGLLKLQPAVGRIETLSLTTSRASFNTSGRMYGREGLSLDIDVLQRADLQTEDVSFNLGQISAVVSSSDQGFLISAQSVGGTARVGTQKITELASTADFTVSGADVSGPVRLSGKADGQKARATLRVDRSSGTTRLQRVEGVIGGLAFDGDAVFKDGGPTDVNLGAELTNFEYAGIKAAKLAVAGKALITPGVPMDLDIGLSASGVQALSDQPIDTVAVNLLSAGTGYAFDGRLTDADLEYPSDLAFNGQIAFRDDLPSGNVSIAGTLFGQPISSRDDVQFTLGSAPTASFDIALLGGHVKGALRSARGETSELQITRVDLSPVLEAYGIPFVGATASGHAEGNLFGREPRGSFEFNIESPVDGIDTAIDMRISGQLDERSLVLTSNATFGPDLAVNAAGRIPVVTQEAQIVRLSATRPLEVLGDVKGDIRSLRLIALAFGHDVSGKIQGRVSLTGSVREPKLAATMNLSEGSYEYGATGLRLTRIEFDARYSDGIFTIGGTGSGAGGGSISANGRLARAEAGVALKMNRLLIYDKSGDSARVSGNATLTETISERLITGTLSVDDATFSFDNYAARPIRTLNIRWESEGTDVQQRRVLEKPIRVNFELSADRGVLVNGRGLATEWGVKLRITGPPNDLAFNGRADLVRGSLELARRPFEFNSGRMTFDGGIQDALIELSATREVDGFVAKADVEGTLARPAIALSSTPTLPTDEILSRMLFGRSSIDLSPLEAAELVSTIARLTGNGEAIDPIGALQAGLGIDRFRFGLDSAGNPEIGIGQYVAKDVFVEVASRGAAGNSVEVEWQPEPQLLISSETTSTGESRVSVRWKKDY